MLTASENGFIQCHVCFKLLSKPVGDRKGDLHCPRCNTVVHERLPGSIGKTWALTLTAFLLLIPANIFPIMTVVYMGEGDPSTIMDGILILAGHGMIPIALIIFVASFAVPFLKLAGLALLLLVVQLRWRLSLRQCTLLFHFVEWVGRWSMLDIFVVAILTALVQMHPLAIVRAEPGALFFGSAVVCTMFAALCFDSRLLWDGPIVSKEASYEPSPL